MEPAPVLIKKYGNRRLCVGPKTVDYLKILVGLQGAAIDGRFRKFLGKLGAVRDHRCEITGVKFRTDLLNH